MSPASTATGIIDDPHDVKGVASTAELEATLTWWRETMPTRFRDPKRPRRILVMQRLHERDLTAEMVKEGATVLCLPMRYERAHPYRYRRDWRTEEGSCSCPTATQPRPRAAGDAPRPSADRRPAPAAPRARRRRHLPRGVAPAALDRAPARGQYAISVDAAFKGTDASDYVVIQVWYTLGPNHFLVDQVRGRMDFVQTVAALTGVCTKYPKALLKLIEDKANGPAIVATLKPKFSGLVEVTPDGSKGRPRAHSVEPLFAGGNVVPRSGRRALRRRPPRRPVGARGEAGAARLPVGGRTTTRSTPSRSTWHVALGSYASRLKAAVDKANPPRPPTLPRNPCHVSSPPRARAVTVGTWHDPWTLTLSRTGRSLRTRPPTS